MRVDEYVDTVREVERRIQLAEEQAASSVLPDLTRPTSVPAEWEDHVKLMFDLQVLALQADMTRVVTFQLAREASTRTYPQIGVPEPHHPISHHVNDPEKLAKLAKINAYHVSLFAYMVDRLKSTDDGDGSLMEHSTFMLGSGMGNPTCTTTATCPSWWRAAATTKPWGGRHVKYDKGTPTGEPAPGAARRRGRAPRPVRRQHRAGRRGHGAAVALGGAAPQDDADSCQALVGP